MSALFAVDPGALRAAGPVLDEAGGALAGVLVRLSVARDAEGECWGRDEAGRAFADAYRPAEDELRVALRLAGNRLREIGEAAVLLSDAADAANEQARQRYS